MTVQSQRFESDGLIVIVTHRPSELQVAWRGVGDNRDPSEQLGPFLQRVVAEAAGRTVRVDFLGLQYVNSATVSPIIQFVKSLDAVARSVTLLYDTSVFWQRTQYRCMRAIAGSLKTVQVLEQVSAH